MPNVKVFNMAGENVGEIALSEKIFGAEVNAPVLHAAVRAYLLNQRQGTHSTKTRSDVSGGGKKPWRQKGTGRARQGSTRSPQWTHGGIAHGPKPRTYGFSINKKVRKLAMLSALSDKVANEEFVVVDKLELKEIKTAEMVKILAAVSGAKKTLVVVPESDEIIYKSARNIEGVKVSPVNAINVYDLVNCNKVVIAKGAVEKLEEVYA